ncbi:hypothetical protein DMC30DRAFT_54829 [Rhodotorula diobovata]|uniref:WD40-repeat-containing domain protein n=1 Tax=Rhodotorula diobovata TaxID=5288 RepID=A0A5C5FR75_9BASI|nr:hypothetical protein DMC30DRAFT_54829 [Rhodotorula diobovata]
MQAPLQLPGYTWDPATKRFFKQQTSAAKLTPAAASRTASSSRKGDQLTKGESSGQQRKRAKRTRDKGKARAEEPRGVGALRSLDLGAWDTAPGRRLALHHDLRATQLSRLSSTRTLFPDCVLMDDSILHLSFDETSPSTLRIGTSSGTLATGSLARPAEELANYPNDEHSWRTSWYCSSKITSLKTCGDRIVATALGPPAQALVGTTQDSISLASVTLSPRKTSLWTSAISPSLLALGCDRKVLVWSDPSRAGQMDAYVTGGNRGDGTVFALDLDGETVFAGTRKGRVHVFDRRASRPAAREGGSSRQSEQRARDEVQLDLASPVTHIRHIKERPHQVVVAGMDGSLGVYDLRFPSRPPPASRAGPAGAATSTPLLEIKGHVNSFTVDLGFDVWRDEWVAVERVLDTHAQPGKTTVSACGPSARAAKFSRPAPPPSLPAVRGRQRSSHPTLPTLSSPRSRPRPPTPSSAPSPLHSAHSPSPRSTPRESALPATRSGSRRAWTQVEGEGEKEQERARGAARACGRRMGQRSRALGCGEALGLVKLIRS